MRGGTQPNPAKCTWPVVREEMTKECIENAKLMERLMKKKTAKDGGKGKTRNNAKDYPMSVFEIK